MYTDSTGYSWGSFWENVKEWFIDEYNEITLSFAISYFGLSYLLPNGFAFATSATFASMLSGFLLACVYVFVVVVVVYVVIKIVQDVFDNNSSTFFEY